MKKIEGFHPYKNEKMTINSVLEFPILRIGWEMDNVGWITEDGKVYTTSHESRFQEMIKEELQALINVSEESLLGLKKALEVLSP